MNTYINKDYLIADNTVISYTGFGEILDLSEDLKNIKINKIGNGSFSELNYITHIKLPSSITRIEDQAFYDSHRIKKIEIPGTVEYIGKDAFTYCSNLKEIVLHGMPISKNTYDELKEQCIKSVDGICVTAKIPDFILNKVDSSIFSEHAVSIPDNIQALFRINDHVSNYDKKVLFDYTENFSFTGKKIPNENDAFIYQIKSDQSVNISSDTESYNDYAVKSEKPLKAEKTYIFTFDDTKTITKNEKVYITAIINIGYFFWQSAQKIICDKTDYYMYRRFYLSGKQEIQYVKEDVAIYKDDELLTDIKEARRVYGKYKLLSIL